MLPLGFSSLLLVILLCGLSQGIEAEAGVPSAAAAREKNHPGLLDYQTGVSVCKQTENLVPNPGFEQGGGEPWEPDHWHETGDCFFSYDDPGPDSDVSARIFAGSSRDENCRLRTTRGESPVEPSRFYSCSASMRTDLLGGDAYLRITFWRWQEDDWEKVGDDYYTGPVTDTQDLWVEVTGSAQAPADAEYAMVEAILPKSSLGSVWFDDVFLGLATCLDISKSDDPDLVEPGQMLTYTIVYSNTGREKATDVEIIETYDEYVDFKRAQPPPLAGTINIWRIPELLSDTSGTITVVVQVEHDIEECAWLSNTAQILSDETVEAISTTITTTVTAIPPTEVDINGPMIGHINTAYTFTATVSPVTVTLPITYVWEASGQPPVVNTSGLSDTVTFTWSTTSTHSITIMAMNDWGIVSDTHFIVISATAYLHLLPTALSFSAVEDGANPAPQTVAITSCGSGQLNWSASKSASWLTISPCSGTTPSTLVVSVSIAGLAMDTYADTIITVGGSAGQNSQQRVSVKLRIGSGKVYLPLTLREWPPCEHEPNNSCAKANGPLISGLKYYGRPNDAWDCFKIDLSTGGQISMRLDGHIEGRCTQLLVYYESQDNMIKDCRFIDPSDRTSECDVTETGAGEYCICIYTTESDPNTDKIYTFQATFP